MYQVIKRCYERPFAAQHAHPTGVYLLYDPLSTHGSDACISLTRSTALHLFPWQETRVITGPNHQLNHPTFDSNDHHRHRFDFTTPIENQHGEARSKEAGRFDPILPQGYTRVAHMSAAGSSQQNLVKNNIHLV